MDSSDESSPEELSNSKTKQTFEKNTQNRKNKELLLKTKRIEYLKKVEELKSKRITFLKDDTVEPPQLPKNSLQRQLK